MAKIKYDEIFITHIKTTCWGKDESLSKKEIIEFGGCLLNVKTLRTSESINLLVKPKEKISDFCSIRTGLTQGDVESGIKFSELIDYIKETYMPENRAWASYGSFTQHVFKKQCQKNDIAFPFSDRYINVKSFFPLIYNLEQETSLKGAMKRMKIDVPTEGVHYDSMDDALNIAIVLKECLRGGAQPCLTVNY